jgi:hypothetical protein
MQNVMNVIGIKTLQDLKRPNNDLSWLIRLNAHIRVVWLIPA